uniref:Caspase family p20 domain-containing protein n=1 Tax=Globodera rostochiensis TaxID=31243 RepID=A0A914HLV7_GLORO
MITETPLPNGRRSRSRERRRTELARATPRAQRSRSASAYELESAFQSPPDLNHRKIYINTSIPRGYALIINNYDFEGGEQRQGSNVDVANITFLLDQLGYRVYENTKKQHSAVVVLMSHGAYDKVYGVDGHSIDLHTFIGCLNAENCPRLRGKPKIMIFQACRGDEVGLRLVGRQRRWMLKLSDKLHQSINVDFLIGQAKPVGRTTLQ